MARRKRKKRKISSTKLVPIETKAQMLVKFPKELVQAFIKLKLSVFGDKEHKKYVKLANEFLGKLKDDRIAQGSLIVQLSRATVKLVENEQKKTKKKAKKKTTKRKEDTGLPCPECETAS